MSQANHAPQACLNALASYLKAQVPGLTVLKEWPAANKKLSYPSATLFTGQPRYMNLAPEQLSISDPDSDKKVTVIEVIGEWDFRMQLDLWCSTAGQRDLMLGKILDAINSADLTPGERRPGGLSLELTDYYNDWARFDLDAQQYVDDGQAAERQERRAKLDLLVNCRAIRERTYYAMVSIEIRDNVTQDGSNMGADATGTDKISVL